MSYINCPFKNEEGKPILNPWKMLPRKKLGVSKDGERALGLVSPETLPTQKDDQVKCQRKISLISPHFEGKQPKRIGM